MGYCVVRLVGLEFIARLMILKLKFGYSAAALYNVMYNKYMI